MGLLINANRDQTRRKIVYKSKETQIIKQSISEIKAIVNPPKRANGTCKFQWPISCKKKTTKLVRGYAKNSSSIRRKLKRSKARALKRITNRPNPKIIPV